MGLPPPRPPTQGKVIGRFILCWWKFQDKNSRGIKAQDQGGKIWKDMKVASDSLTLFSLFSILRVSQIYSGAFSCLLAPWPSAVAVSPYVCMLSRSVVSDSLRLHGLYSIHGIFQARILKLVPISFSRESSRDWILVSFVFCIGNWILYYYATWEAHLNVKM